MRPTVTVRTEELYALLPEYQRDADELLDWPLLRYVSLLGDILNPLKLYLDDPGSLADPQRAPYGLLPWLAMFAGVDYRVYPDTDGNRLALREAITVSQGARLPGSQGATVKAIKPLLTGTKLVRVSGINPSAGTYMVTTYGPQTPDPAAVAAAAQAQKPAGLGLTVQVIPGQSFDDLKRNGQTFDQVKASGLTFNQLKMVVPSE